MGKRTRNYLTARLASFDGVSDNHGASIDMLALMSAISVLFPSIALAGLNPESNEAGAVYEITTTKETSSVNSEGSTGSSYDRDALIERVLRSDAGDLELEYDLPPDTKKEDREREWQFPVRVLKKSAGSFELLNEAEMTARRDRWLALAKLPRAACGRWYFTWNAFQIQCDPKTVISLLEAVDLRPVSLADGAIYTERGALEPGQFGSEAAGGTRHTARLKVDPDAVRRDEANSDVVVAEISGKTLPFAEALKARAGEQISGTVTITFETDDQGEVWRKVAVTRVHLLQPNGKSEERTTTETIERKRIVATK